MVSSLSAHFIAPEDSCMGYRPGVDGNATANRKLMGKQEFVAWNPLENSSNFLLDHLGQG